LAVLIVERLLPVGARVLIAVDDTLLHRLGRKIHACFGITSRTPTRSERRSLGATIGS
jgi:hypothetical protein